MIAITPIPPTISATLEGLPDKLQDHEYDRLFQVILAGDLPLTALELRYGPGTGAAP